MRRPGDLRAVGRGRRPALLATLCLLAAAGCSGSSADGQPEPNVARGGNATVADGDRSPAGPGPQASRTSLAALCGVPEERLASLAEQASVFEEYHSVSETPAEILEIVRARAATSARHPDDCLALIEHHALERSGCHPGVRTYPWMGCDFAEERAPG